MRSQQVGRLQPVGFESCPNENRQAEACPTCSLRRHRVSRRSLRLRRTGRRRARRTRCARSRNVRPAPPSFRAKARLQQAIASLEQPADSLDRSGLLLAQCRSELAESLDDQQARANRSAWRSIFSPVAWWGALRHTLIYHPAMSMTVLVVAGFLAGVAGQRLRVVPSQAVSPRPVMTVSALLPKLPTSNCRAPEALTWPG